MLRNFYFFIVFFQLSKTYGPVMTLYLGWQRTVLLTGYDAVKEALVDQADDFTGRGPLPFLLKATKGYGNTRHLSSALFVIMIPFFSLSLSMLSVVFSESTRTRFPLSGLGISNGERWRQLRRFTLSTLRDFGMGRKGMEEWIQEESKHLTAHIKTQKGRVSPARCRFKDKDYIDCLLKDKQLNKLHWNVKMSKRNAGRYGSAL